MTPPPQRPGGAMAGGRAFVDATGTPVPLSGIIRRVVVTDPDVGALLVEVGAQPVGCAGGLEGAEAVGDDRAPDPAAVAALHPDVIVTGTVGGAHDLVRPALVGALRQIAPVIAVDLDRRTAAVADLRALLGAVAPPGSPAARRPPG